MRGPCVDQDLALRYEATIVLPGQVVAGEAADGCADGELLKVSGTSWVCAADATGGVYVNFMPEDETDRTASAFGPNLDRLAEVKSSFDPENRLRRNQNIRPTTAS